MTDTKMEFLLARYAEDEGSVLSGECRCDDDGPKRPDCADRVLAEVDAKRKILEAYERAYYGDHADETVHEQARREALDDVVRLLALPYADHPDYREEWRQ